jgi:putative transposase
LQGRRLFTISHGQDGAIALSEYRRYYVDGAIVFFTLVTLERRKLFDEELAGKCLHDAIATIRTKRPFTIDAVVLLPDHLDMLWTLPADDGDFSVRWRRIKSEFTESYLAAGGHEGTRSVSRRKRKERGIWQRRFWDHVVRDDLDFERHLDYIHYNPVKHRYVPCPRDWPYSSFQRWVERGVRAQVWRYRRNCDGMNRKQRLQVHGASALRLTHATTNDHLLV